MNIVSHTMQNDEIFKLSKLERQCRANISISFLHSETVVRLRAQHLAQTESIGAFLIMYFFLRPETNSKPKTLSDVSPVRALLWPSSILWKAPKSKPHWKSPCLRIRWRMCLTYHNMLHQYQQFSEFCSFSRLKRSSR